MLLLLFRERVAGPPYVTGNTSRHHRGLVFATALWGGETLSDRRCRDGQTSQREGQKITGTEGRNEGVDR